MDLLIFEIMNLKSKESVIMKITISFNKTPCMLDYEFFILSKCFNQIFIMSYNKKVLLVFP